jgi:hypothetical protein
MASSDIFQTVLLKDPIIGDLTDSLDYSVYSGGSSSTYQQFQATSASNSSLVWSIQLPSESIVFDRHALINTQIGFTITIGQTTPVTTGATIFDLGYTDSLQAFPLNKLFNTITATFNNANVNVNSQDIIDALLRLNDSRSLYKYNGMTPTLPDQTWANYSQAVGSNSNPLASLNNQSYDLCQLPRGAFPVRVFLFRYTNAGGALPIDSSPIATGVAGEYWQIFCSTTVTEPLIGLSPFIFGETSYNCGGIVGLNTLSIVANLDSTCKRFWSTALVTGSYQVSLGTANIPTTTYFGGGALPVGLPAPNANAFTGTRLLLHFESIQPSDRVSTRCVTPYQEFPRYISLSTSNSAIAVGGSATISSQSIQLNQLPDYFIILSRIPMQSQTPKNSSSFLAINSISVNLNNTSGLLASATSQDLWRISQDNHSTQSWNEWNGFANINVNATGVGSVVNTIGSILILNPAKNLSICDYLSSGSIGQYQLQFNVNVTNTTSSAVQPELVLICVNSGVFITETGSSQIATGILTKEAVLAAKEQTEVAPYSTAMHTRMVGGSLTNMTSGALKSHRHMLMRHIRRSHRERRGPSANENAGMSGFSRKGLDAYL